jgi:hypothetical protein
MRFPRIRRFHAVQRRKSACLLTLEVVNHTLTFAGLFASNGVIGRDLTDVYPYALKGRRAFSLIFSCSGVSGQYPNTRRSDTITSLCPLIKIMSPFIPPF